MTSAADKLASFLALGDSLGELEVTIGQRARPVVAQLRVELAEAAARRQNGDVAGALSLIRHAMEQMAMLAGELDEQESALMRLLAVRFSQALSAGDKGTAKEAIDFMRHKAGDPKDEPENDW